MDGASFAEWVAYDSLEPIDPAGTLLAGMSPSKSSSTPPVPAAGWQKQMSFMKTMFPVKNPDAQ